MIEKSKGIVFNQFKYSETSIITTIYTEKYGRLSFIINGARSIKAKIKANIFQPLTVIEFDFYYNKRNHLQRIKEIRLIFPFNSIPFNVYKCTIALFLAEILEKTIREEEPNTHLFSFIFDSVLLLDLSEGNTSNIHLNFLFGLTKHLGFYPHNNYSETNRYFNIKEGMFVSYYSSQSYCINEELSKYFSHFLSPEQTKIELNQLSRNKMLENLLNYYYIHLESIKEIQSFRVLKEVFGKN